MFDVVQPIDDAILFTIQQWHNPFLDFIMPIISFISDNGYIWIPVIVLMIIFKRTRRVGICMAITFAACIGLGLGLKYLIARPRPTDLHPEVSLIIDRPEALRSFPSGHTIMSFGMAFVLWFQTWKFGLPATVFACIVGFSRLYLFCHNPSDVAASIILAAAAALLTVLIAWLILRDKGGLRPYSRRRQTEAPGVGSGKHYGG